MLHEMQSAFRAGLTGGQTEAAEAFVMGGRIAAEDRMAVYTNNYMVSLIGVLEAAYPAIRRLVGAENFSVLAVGYIRRHPPLAPRLSTYGAGFAEHVESVPAAIGELPFLADLARLEWACQLAYFAADAPVLTPNRLIQIPMERYPELRLTPHPSTHWLASDHAIHDLWRAEEVPAPPPETAQSVIISRGPRDLVVARASNGELALLDAFAGGASLAEAAEAAMGLEPELDLQFTLATHLQRGSFQDDLDAAAAIDTTRPEGKKETPE